MLDGRPRPIASPETRAFWEACRRGVFLLQRCRDCGQFQYHYRRFCCHCWSQDVVDVPIDGGGTVWTFTVIDVNRMDGFRQLVPYVVALIELPYGGVRILSNVINCDPDRVAIGMPVKLTFDTGSEEVPLPMFEPA